MYNHSPKDYICPMCNRLAGEEDEYTAATDIVYKTDLITAFISPKWWENNPGHVIIISNKHFENMYDLPSEYAHAVIDAAKVISLAMKKAYECDGI